MTTTLHQDQADTRVSAYVALCTGELPDGAVLTELIRQVSPCTDPDDGGPASRVVVSSTNRVDGLTGYPAVFDGLAAALAQRDFVVLEDSRPDHENMFLWLENRVDGFRITLQSNDLGELYLVVTAPCAWPS